MYLSPNLKSKAAYKRAIKNGVKVTALQPNNIFNVKPPQNGAVTFEGPHYPKPHRFYGQATIVNGVVTAVK